MTCVYRRSIGVSCCRVSFCGSSIRQCRLAAACRNVSFLFHPFLRDRASWIRNAVLLWRLAYVFLKRWLNCDAVLLSCITTTHHIDIAFLSVCPSVRRVVALYVNECTYGQTFSAFAMVIILVRFLFTIVDFPKTRHT